jgi:hypothetical protein
VDLDILVKSRAGCTVTSSTSARARVTLTRSTGERRAALGHDPYCTEPHGSSLSINHRCCMKIEMHEAPASHGSANAFAECWLWLGKATLIQRRWGVGQPYPLPSTAP